MSTSIKRGPIVKFATSTPRSSSRSLPDPCRDRDLVPAVFHREERPCDVDIVARPVVLEKGPVVIADPVILADGGAVGQRVSQQDPVWSRTKTLTNGFPPCDPEEVLALDRGLEIRLDRPAAAGRSGPGRGKRGEGRSAASGRSPGSASRGGSAAAPDPPGWPAASASRPFSIRSSATETATLASQRATAATPASANPSGCRRTQKRISRAADGLPPASVGRRSSHRRRSFAKRIGRSVAPGRVHGRGTSDRPRPARDRPCRLSSRGLFNLPWMTRASVSRVVSAPERRPAGEHGVEDGAEAVNVGGRRDV